MSAPLPSDVFPTTIETPRLSLHRPSASKIELYASQAQAACGHSSLLSVRQTRAFAEFMVGHWERFGFGFLAANVRDGASSMPVGHIGFKYVDARPGHWPQTYDAIELGYSLVPAARGNGYATEGGRAALTAAFDAFGIASVFAKCNRDNVKSAAVLLRCGMAEIESPDDMRRFRIDRPA